MSAHPSSGQLRPMTGMSSVGPTGGTLQGQSTQIRNNKKSRNIQSAYPSLQKDGPNFLSQNRLQSANPNRLQSAYGPKRGMSAKSNNPSGRLHSGIGSQSNMRPISKYKDYEREIDEIFEESQVVGNLVLLQKLSLMESDLMVWEANSYLPRAVLLSILRIQLIRITFSTSQSFCNFLQCPIQQ